MFGLEYFRHWFGARPVTINPKIVSNPLAGKPLRYLIGASGQIEGSEDAITVVPFDEPPARRGKSIGYCNFLDQRDSYDKDSNTGDYGPYRPQTDTAKEYGEGVPDSRGRGWTKNLEDQFERRKEQGFEYIELDNPDAYDAKDVLGAVTLAATYGLEVLAKNPGLVEDRVDYVHHPNVFGIIVEKGAGNAADMDELRRKAGKPGLPVWFVAFGSGRSWAKEMARAAKPYRDMRVTYSEGGEYVTSVDV